MAGLRKLHQLLQKVLALARQQCQTANLFVLYPLSSQLPAANGGLTLSFRLCKMRSWQVEEVRSDDGYDLLLFSRLARSLLSMRPSMLAS
jgi:hypothetical protein